MKQNDVSIENLDTIVNSFDIKELEARLEFAGCHWGGPQTGPHAGEPGLWTCEGDFK